MSARWWRAIAGIAVTAGFSWLLLRNSRLADIGAQVSRVPASALLLALVWLCADYSARIVRWWCMLAALDARVPARACVRPFLASIAINNVLPLRAGDAVRVFGFRDSLPVSVAGILMTVVVERVLDLLALSALLIVGLWNSTQALFPRYVLVTTSAIASAGAVALVVVVVMSPTLREWTHRVAVHPRLVGRRWAGRLHRIAEQLLVAVATLRSGSLVVRLLVFTGLIWGLEGAVFAQLAYGLQYGGGLYGPWFATAAGTLSTLIPSSPGYIGTFDFFTARGFEAYGLLPASATACALLIHAVLWVPLTLVGLAVLLIASGRPAQELLAAAGKRPGG